MSAVTSQKACASCSRPRGNVRAGWTPILKNDVVTGFTCPSCPTAREPIRRVETKAGRIVFRARLSGERGERGRQGRQVSASFDQLDDARAWVTEVRTAVAVNGAWGAAARAAGETVVELCERWIATRIDIRQVTRDGYRQWLAPIKRHPIATMPVAEVEIATVQGLVTWLAREGARPRKGRETGTPLAPNSVRSVRIALQQAVDLAVAEGTVTRNVVRLARWPKNRVKRGRDLEHWQPEELLRFRGAADEHRWAGAWRMTLSGMTRADVMGQRWPDFDLTTGIASVSQGRVALENGQTAVDDPKSAQRVRAVPVEAIHPGSVALVKRMKAKQAQDKLAAGAAWGDSGYIVVDEVGDPIRPEVYSDEFRRLCSTAGVRVIKLHSVRHSLAFWLHQLGVAPADAAALLGHSVEVHLSTYLPHSGAAGIQAAARALGQAAQLQKAASED